jgi:hypothetical protein
MLDFLADRRSRGSCWLLFIPLGGMSVRPKCCFQNQRGRQWRSGRGRNTLWSIIPTLFLTASSIRHSRRTLIAIILPSGNCCRMCQRVVDIGIAFHVIWLENIFDTSSLWSERHGIWHLVAISGYYQRC